MTRTDRPRAEETFTPSRPGLVPSSVSGPTAYWPDGLTTYTLRFRGGHNTWVIADEADTILAAVNDLHSGTEVGKGVLQHRLRDVRRLMTRLTAIEEELVLYAREAGPDREARLSWREIGEELGSHFTTVRERHKRVASGQGSHYRTWLVQHTPREQMYPTADGQPAVPPATAAPKAEPATEAHKTAVYDWPERDNTVISRCTCGWKGLPTANAISADREGKEHEAGADS
ncbi:AsnC family protein [Kitasatospora purpeofusca]|uniref:AsnC family protein n=1 Tax=Kitasatospora purpeofusca TaxID=67352 RepID=UPI00068ED042|nr:AsnC family protein [Kitasatospora purpeofusca]